MMGWDCQNKAIQRWRASLQHSEVDHAANWEDLNHRSSLEKSSGCKGQQEEAKGVK